MYNIYIYVRVCHDNKQLESVDNSRKVNMLNLHKSHNALMIEPFQTHSRWNATSLSGPHLQNVSYLHLQDPWLMWTPLTNQWWLRVHCSRTQGHREHPCDIWIQRIEPNLLNYGVLNWISGSVAKGNLRLHWRCAGHDLGIYTHEFYCYGGDVNGICF